MPSHTRVSEASRPPTSESPAGWPRIHLRKDSNIHMRLFPPCALASIDQHITRRHPILRHRLIGTRLGPWLGRPVSGRDGEGVCAMM